MIKVVEEKRLYQTYETGEKLRLIRAEMVMTRRETFETDGELDVTRADNILNFKIRKLGIKTKFLNDSCVFTRRQARVLVRRQQVQSTMLCGNPPSSDLAPVTTILPEAKIRAVVLGSRIRMMTAAKRFGLYSAFLA